MATTKGRALVTDLVGSVLKPEMVQVEVGVWPETFRPNAADQHMAVIRAVWVDNEGTLMVLAQDVYGTQATLDPAHFRLTS
jgi:hypothetical protein